MTQSDQNPPPPQDRASFSADFRRFFVRGLATLLPTLITILLLLKIWEILWDYLGRHIIGLLGLITYHIRPEKGIGWWAWFWQVSVPEWLRQLLGVGLAIILVYIVGLFVGHIIGRTLWRMLEVGWNRIPLIRAIYPAVKQITDFVLAERKTQLLSGRVVAVEPHASGIWSIGMVTGPGIRSLSDSVGSDMVTVFVPSTPTAFAGYVLVVPRHKVIELPLTVEELMRILVSGGVLMPEQAMGQAPVGRRDAMPGGDERPARLEVPARPADNG